MIIITIRVIVTIVIMHVPRQIIIYVIMCHDYVYVT